jgi:acetolactate synthase-1/2/3 large subunit
MAYALPSAIGAALADPARPVLAFTGDGGLMMGAGELGTAVQEGANVKLVVFNDASIALIEVKQRRRQFPLQGMRYAPADLAAVARGFGWQARRVETPEELGPALREAFATPGPVLLDVAVEAEAYHAMVAALRG